MKKQVLLVMLLAVFMLFGGCRKPYDVEEFKEIQTYETAFVVPLEGDLGDQVQFSSAEGLREMQVAIKRIPIPHRFHQTGRGSWNGVWIPTVKIITVDRRPITREWTADANSGTSQGDEAIWIESADSVGFSVGFTCTAFIDAENTAEFLYQYSSQSLAEVMDAEVRARIQARAAEIASIYNLDDLRGRKQEIIDAVREDVTTFFANRGITITTVGMFGGFTYESPEIQDAIDSVFVAQQQEETALAELNAQTNRNQTIEMAASAAANAIKIRAEGEAEAVRVVAQASGEANSNPAFIELRRLEVEQSRIAKWNGAYPTHLWTTGENGNLGIIVNTPE